MLLHRFAMRVRGRFASPDTPFARLLATLLTYASLLGKLRFPAGGHPLTRT